MISDESFAKKEHILKTGDFGRVYKKGSSRKTGELVLYRLPNGLGYNRIGFSISSNRIKLATRRNRVRRIIREIYRKKKKDFKKGFDVVIVIRKDFARNILYKKVEEVFLKLAAEAGLV